MDLSSGFPHGQAPVPTSNSARYHALGTLSECLFFSVYTRSTSVGSAGPSRPCNFWRRLAPSFPNFQQKTAGRGAYLPYLFACGQSKTMRPFATIPFAISHITPPAKPQFKPPHSITRSHHSWPRSLSYMCLRTSWQRGRHSATQTCKPTD